MKVTANFQNNNVDTAYEIMAGSVLNEEFTETLDSAKIILSNVEESDRLTNLSCYERVLLEFGDDITKYMLVDDYIEDMLYLSNDGNTYEYNISLMSYTKLLEKIQLPNRLLNRSLVQGQKTINEVIQEMIDLYVPKCKMKISEESSEYAYVPIITWQNPEKFDIPCPYFQWNKPTLRTVLTSLMNVAGCIPKMNGRILTYLDFNEEPTEFDISKGEFNYVSRSNSSDSFVNTLNMQPENVLDENNYTIVENLGFRDEDKVYLKQTDNLKLRTRLPIYDIKKADYIVPVKETVTIANYSKSGLFNAYLQIKVLGNTAFIRARNNYDGFITNTKSLVFKNVTVTSFHYDSNNAIIYDQTESLGNITVSNASQTIESVSLTSIPTYTCVYCEGLYYVGKQLEPESSVALMDNQYIRKLYYDSGYPGTYDPSVYDTNGNGTPLEKIIWRNYKKDITDLFKEKKVRQLLETNFSDMNNETFTSVSDMSKYIYSTVEYTVGSKEITGFSDSYSVSYGFFEKNKTYIENISNKLFDLDKDGDSFDIAYYLGGIPKLTYIDGEDPEVCVDVVTNRNIEFCTDTDTFKYPLFTSAVFSIEYQPMNSFNIKYPKSNAEAPYMLEQIDNQTSSIPQFDDLSTAERNKADRVGNEVISINQRIDNFSEIQPLNSIYNDAIVFKRSIQLYSDFALVKYTASKNYVLKNFYTSIATKYRAYEYSDYEGSIIRKENTIVYCLLDTYYFEGDYKITFSDNSLKKYMIDGCVYHDKDNRLRYNILEEPDGETYKNDLSVISDKNNLLFVYQEYDSHSFGPALKNEYDAEEGGVAQTWEIMDEDYWDNHYVYFTNDFEKEKLDYVYNNETDMENFIQDLAEYPAIDFDTSNSSYIRVNTFFDKYVNEVINHTVQFHFYTNNENIKWTKNFLDLCSLKTEKSGIIRLMINPEYDMVEDEYQHVENDVYINYSYVTVDETNDGIPYIKIDWHNLSLDFPLALPETVRVVKDLGDDTYLDIIQFTKISGGEDIYYMSLNDTRSETVHANSTLLQPVGTIDHNTIERTFTEE